MLVVQSQSNFKQVIPLLSPVTFKSSTIGIRPDTANSFATLGRTVDWTVWLDILVINSALCFLFEWNNYLLLCLYVDYAFAADFSTNEKYHNTLEVLMIPMDQPAFFRQTFLFLFTYNLVNEMMCTDWIIILGHTRTENSEHISECR